MDAGCVSKQGNRFHRAVSTTTIPFDFNVVFPLLPKEIIVLFTKTWKQISIQNSGSSGQKETALGIDKKIFFWRGGGTKPACPLKSIKEKGDSMHLTKITVFLKFQKTNKHPDDISPKQSSVLLFSDVHMLYWQLHRGHFLLLHLMADLGQPHVWGVQPLPANVHMQMWQISDWRSHYWQFYSRIVRS